MQQTPTPWQFLLDIISAAKLKAAETIQNPIAREAAIKKYKDLREGECKFSTPIKNKTTAGAWLVDITVAGRGFKLESVAYKTGTIIGMSKPNANVMLMAETLDLSTTTGLYFVEQTQQLHLLVHPQSNIWEALQMTGYQFSPKQFQAVQYDTRNTDLKADGHIDISDSVVAGRVYVSFIQRSVEKAPVSEVIPPEEAGLPINVEGLEQAKVDAGLTPAPVSNPTDLTKQDISLPQELLETSKEEQKPELTEKEQIQALLAQEAAETSQEEEVADKEEVAKEETQQPQQNFNQKNKKK